MTMKTTQALMRSARFATTALMRGWIILPLCLALYLAVILVSIPISAIDPTIASVLMGLVHLVALSQFYSWCWKLLRSERISLRRPWGLVDHIFANVGFVGFILWITFSLIAPLGAGPQSNFGILLRLAVVFLFNPIIEVSIVGLASQGALFTEAVRVARDHLLTWFLPFLVMIGLGVLIQGQLPSATGLVLHFASTFNVMFPAAYFLTIAQNLLSNGYFGVLMAIPIICWITLFRISLLEQLE